MNRAEQALSRALEEGAARTPAGEPAFAAALRRAGAGTFASLLLPTTRHEDWRYTSLSPMSDLALEPAGRASPAPDLVARLGGLPPAPRLVLVNGRIEPGLCDLAGLPPGAVAGSLAAALRERPALLEPHLGQGPIPAQALGALNAALFDDGAFLHLPEGSAAARPIHVLHLTLAPAGAAPAAAFPRSLVVAGRGARAQVVERWAGEGTYLAAPVAEVVLQEGSELEWIRVQGEAPGAFHLAVLAVRQAAGSRFTGRSLALGARLARLETRAVLEGEGAENHLDGLYLAAGAQLQDHFVHVDHAAPRGTSRELFKGILDGSARGVFAGRILVREGAQKTDAGQVNSNLLLSEEATVDTRPQLEILADDVKCSHGGTVGQLDEDALFYLRSRGLDRATARALLTWAFAAEMVERIPAPLRPAVRELVTARLPDGDRLREAA